MTRSFFAPFASFASPFAILCLLLGVFILAGCGGADKADTIQADDMATAEQTEQIEQTEASDYPAEPGETIAEREADGLFSNDALSLFNDDEAAPRDEKIARPNLGVNGYLWRASLDALSFLPLSSADPIGGVIISDWYSEPKTPNERVKVTVYILDKRLRADGLRVSIFRQQKNAGGEWQSATASYATARRLENAILTRAREMRLVNIDSE